MMPLLVLLLCAVIVAACTQEDLTDAGGVAARSLCQSARNCSYHDPKPY